MLLQFWSRWADVLVIVKSKTVVGWHRAGFRWYWRWRSRPPGCQPKIWVDDFKSGIAMVVMRCS